MMYASVAQAFSSTGEGFALKGSSIPHDQVINKSPYLKYEEAGELIKRVINKYQIINGTFPSRVVVHKTSRYQPEEFQGFKDAILEKVSSFELVWLVPSGFRLLRRGLYPPNRGLLCTLSGDQYYLFTTGYVPRWDEYPGPHIPSPLEIGTSHPERIKETAKEILALTKMNWNNSEGIGRHPITISFARRIGVVMTELGDNEEPNSSYRFYM
jgi:argonaute-like protein implicated in RNA metabolism and viral defense